MEQIERKKALDFSRIFIVQTTQQEAQSYKWTISSYGYFAGNVKAIKIQNLKLPGIVKIDLFLKSPPPKYKGNVNIPQMKVPECFLKCNLRKQAEHL